jgi:hypothetical protein
MCYPPLVFHRAFILLKMDDLASIGGEEPGRHCLPFCSNKVRCTTNLFYLLSIARLRLIFEKHISRRMVSIPLVHCSSLSGEETFSSFAFALPRGVSLKYQILPHLLNFWTSKKHSFDSQFDFELGARSDNHIRFISKKEKYYFTGDRTSFIFLHERLQFNCISYFRMFIAVPKVLLWGCRRSELTSKLLAAV